jgi:hypothetical protein
MTDVLMFLFAAIAGVAAAASMSRLPASGKVALALTPVPIAGVLLAMKFC